ncbi:MAG: aminotransferase class V-fold PLP-dependent enzyme, partial [Patescibacteria group bacterium]
MIISAIEHESVLETARDLERSGEAEVVCLPVDSRGVVDLKKLEESLNDRTVLVSIMHASNEIGTIQPISKISEIIRNFRNSKLKTQNSKQFFDSKTRNKSVSDFRFRDSNLAITYPLFHTDAAQTFQYLDCNPDTLGIDLMTLSAQKMYGPKGAGALNQRLDFSVKRTGEGVVRALTANRSTLAPIITGGSHEFGLRAGTPNVPAIVGFGKAAEVVSNSRELANSHTRKLRDLFLNGLKKIYPNLRTNPDSVSAFISSNHRESVFLPSILNIYFPGHLASDLLIKLDMAGIAAASGSACSARSSKPSHVLKALGLPMERVTRSVRFS